MKTRKPRAANKTLPSHKELHNIFNYNEDTGELTRKSNGKVITTQNRSGHLVAEIDSRLYYVHRIIWKMMTGREPELGKIIEHRSGVPSQNQWSNLRECTYSQNMMNRNPRSSHPGVYASGKKWRANICLNYQSICLGTWETLDEACQARRQAEEKYFGPFAAAARAAATSPKKDEL